ncbi:hypothetical protein GCM10011380_14450 [Sphingomonas metalli]|uniref:PilZ domain-containing protein n=1 Tax=Sphingomonas metalli TaxID=1779358 RepID=A0A916T348_9SPHN|nr:PilZ domain-containing protein [Sphingomonas metalli]GGB25971.1 hypothetical protein GCM10011380_14450 [Sphingomonas metalli]
MALTAQLFRADDERAADRRSVNLDGTLRQQDDRRPVDVMIEDLSATGFRMVCSEPMALDATITVGIAGLGRHVALIVRSAPPQYGCRFLSPIDVSGVEASVQPTILAPDFGWTGPATKIDVDPPLDAVEQRIRMVRGPIIAAGLIVPWIVIGMICAAIL